MSATPEASNEYSTGDGGSRGAPQGDSDPAFERGSGPAWRAARRSSRSIDRGSWILFAVAALAAVLLVAAEFTTLYQAHIATKVAPTQSVTAGSHNSYAMLPIAVLAAAFGFGVWRSGSRVMLLALGVLGVIALLVALLHDLPDAHAVGLADNNSVSATTTPNAGLYIETLGAILLLATSGLGFIVLGGVRKRR